MSMIRTSKPIGAAWWQEELYPQWRPTGSVLPAAASLIGSAALGSGGCALIQLNDDMDVERDSLALQQQEGWNVGHPDGELDFPGFSPYDADGSQSWRVAMQTLPQVLAPAQAQLAPFYVPTLFQALASPTAASAALRIAVKPIITDEMRAAFARGQALLSVFEEANWPTDTAIIVDVPGPQSVALAAGMSERFEPVFTFDNWPHPLGVVPSHLTLAAALYYSPVFARTARTRPQPAPPVFVLDSNRLADYTDQDGEFDNRYWAKLPGAEAFVKLGIRHVLYVTPTGAQQEELDDLNEDFVALGQAGVDVKMLPLTDFEESVEVEPLYVGWDWDLRFHFRLFFGGSPFYHHCFWEHYGWHRNGGPVHIGQPPPRISRGNFYLPRTRDTLFQGAPARGSYARATWRPQHFGRVETRTSRWDGRLSGLRAGRTGSYSPTFRSGSIGRMSASFGGG
jgi:hypothetical protein